MAVAAEEGGGEEKKVAATCRAKGASGAAESFDERNPLIPARQRAILTRVLSHWKRTTQRGSQTSTPSENLYLSCPSDPDLQLGPWLSKYPLIFEVSLWCSRSLCTGRFRGTLKPLRAIVEEDRCGVCRHLICSHLCTSFKLITVW